jgi:hypothetical protein
MGGSRSTYGENEKYITYYIQFGKVSKRKNGGDLKFKDI